MVTRYDPYARDDSGLTMKETPDGEWVSFDDFNKYTNHPRSDNDHIDNIIGLKIMEVLHLKTNDKNRIDTNWGDKTPVGLARVIKRIIKEGENFK